MSQPLRPAEISEASSASSKKPSEDTPLAQWHDESSTPDDSSTRDTHDTAPRQLPFPALRHRNFRLFWFG
ncbi:MAG TPA: hypothetical protein VGB77_07095, partial [Abditibacteriaceae bacterium]